MFMSDLLIMMIHFYRLKINFSKEDLLVSVDIWMERILN